jgi:type I restriction enzyme S subunit
VANVQDGYLDLSDIKTIHILAHEEERYRLRVGDVLMNEGGDFDKLGRGTVWQGQIPRCLHQNHVFRVRCHGESLKPWFLAALTESYLGKSYFVRSSKQTTNLATINSTQIKAFPLRLPSSQEQDQIVRAIGGVQERIDAEVDLESKFRLLKTGLMDDLLTGRVRVTPLLEAEP